MGIRVTFNGTEYTIPAPGETGWATSLNEYLSALGAATVVVPPTWTDVSSFSNGWVEYNASYVGCRYCLDDLNFVHIELTMKQGTLGAVAFTLPAGFRPPKTVMSSAWVSDGMGGTNNIGRVIVEPSGNVTLSANSGYNSTFAATFSFSVD